MIRPILKFLSTNQMLPSGPAVMPEGPLIGVGNSVMTPVGVMRPMAPRPSANQTFPSGPAVMYCRLLLGTGSGNSVITPAGVMRPILLPVFSVNQMLPSGPEAMPRGPLPTVGTPNSVMSWAWDVSAQAHARTASVTAEKRSRRPLARTFRRERRIGIRMGLLLFLRRKD